VPVVASANKFVKVLETKLTECRIDPVSSASLDSVQDTHPGGGETIEEARMKPIRLVLRALYIAALVLSFTLAAAGHASADPIVVTDDVFAPVDPAPGVDLPIPSESPDDPEFE
jgi:hypothetical protein